MTRQVDYRQVLGPDFAIARIQNPPGCYVELELDILERPVHRFFRDRYGARRLEEAREFRDTAFGDLPVSWLEAVLAEFDRLRELRNGTGIRRTSTKGVGYWAAYGATAYSGRHPRRTYSAERYGETGARYMALFARAQENIRLDLPGLLGADGLNGPPVSEALITTAV